MKPDTMDQTKEPPDSASCIQPYSESWLGKMVHTFPYTAVIFSPGLSRNLIDFSRFSPTAAQFPFSTYQVLALTVSCRLASKCGKNKKKV